MPPEVHRRNGQGFPVVINFTTYSSMFQGLLDSEDDLALISAFSIFANAVHHRTSILHTRRNSGLRDSASSPFNTSAGLEG